MSSDLELTKNDIRAGYVAWCRGEVPADMAGAQFDRFIAGVKEDARAGALIRGAEIGWDAAVSAMQFEDGTKPDLVEVVNPYRAKEEA